VGQGAEARGGARRGGAAQWGKALRRAVGQGAVARGGGMISRRLLGKYAVVACCPGARLQTLAASRMDHHHDAPHTLMD